MAEEIEMSPKAHVAQLICVEFVVVFAEEHIVWTGPVGIPNCITQTRQQIKAQDVQAIVRDARGK